MAKAMDRIVPRSSIVVRQVVPGDAATSTQQFCNALNYSLGRSTAICRYTISQATQRSTQTIISCATMQCINITSARGSTRGSTAAWHLKCPAVLSTSSSNRPARQSVIVAGSSDVYTVTMVLPNGKEAVFRAGTSRSIYDIASYAGVHLPASCKQGTCTACCGKVLSGRVSQPKQKCIPAALVKEGYGALCCATPASDVKIQTHQGPAIKHWKSEHANK